MRIGATTLLGAAALALASPAQAAPSATILSGLTGTWPSASDSSAAASPLRTVQIVNNSIRIALRLGSTAATPLAQGSTDAFVGVGSGLSYANDIIWDDTSQRFYFVVVSGLSSGGSKISVGWSKSATPSTLTDWCSNSVDIGERVFLPTIGDTTNRFVVGYSRFNSSSGAFNGSDLLFVPKPGAGTTCPGGTIAGATKANLTTSAGKKLFAPAVANQIDDSTTGYAVATVVENATTLAAQIGLVAYTEASPAPLMTFSFSTIATGSVTFPPAVPQRGGTLLNTGSAQFTQAVLAKVPRNSNAFSLFTSRTVANGTSTAVDWFEFNPGATSLRRSGRITGAFNSAITSDRRAGVTTSGNNLVVVYNKSSADFYPRAFASSSVNGAASTAAQIEASAGPFRDPTVGCTSSGPEICPWAGASAAPDPLGGRTIVSVQLPAATSATVDTNRWRARVYSVAP